MGCGKGEKSRGHRQLRWGRPRATLQAGAGTAQVSFWSMCTLGPQRVSGGNADPRWGVEGSFCFYRGVSEPLETNAFFNLKQTGLWKETCRKRFSSRRASAMIERTLKGFSTALQSSDPHLRHPSCIPGTRLNALH